MKKVSWDKSILWRVRAFVGGGSERVIEVDTELIWRLFALGAVHNELRVKCSFGTQAH